MQFIAMILRTNKIAYYILCIINFSTLRAFYHFCFCWIYYEKCIYLLAIYTICLLHADWGINDFLLPSLQNMAILTACMIKCCSCRYTLVTNIFERSSCPLSSSNKIFLEIGVPFNWENLHTICVLNTWNIFKYHLFGNDYSFWSNRIFSHSIPQSYHFHE